MYGEVVWVECNVKREGGEGSGRYTDRHMHMHTLTHHVPMRERRRQAERERRREVVGVLVTEGRKRIIPFYYSFFLL